jgi:hypothetical protein
MSSDAGDRMSLVEFVAQSPRLCAAHDKAGWVGLFARDAEINDPVGSAPHRGTGAISRFYDTFIAPNHIAFAVEHDVVCGMSVMRDLTIRTTMSTGVTLDVPMHLRYDLVEEDGALKIRRLFAHWELPYMIGLLMKQGLKGLWTSIKLGPQLIAHQGLGGMLGFLRGFLGNGRAGKKAAEAFLAAAARGDADAAGALLDHRCELELPAHTPIGLPELVGRLRSAQWRKMIAAGDFVTVTLQAGGRRGVALLRFDYGPQRISGVQVFI